MVTTTLVVIIALFQYNWGNYHLEKKSNKPASSVVNLKNLLGKLLSLSREKSQGSWLERHYVLHWTLFGPHQKDSQEYTFHYYMLPRTKQWLCALWKTLQIRLTVTKSHWHRRKFALPVHLSCLMMCGHQYESLGEAWGSHASSSAYLFAPCSRPPSLFGNNLP